MSTSPIVSSVQAITGSVSTASVTEFTCAGAANESFSVTYTVGEILVFYNGVLLDNGTASTASNGTTVVLEETSIAGDIVTTDTGKLTFSAEGTGVLTADEAASTATALAIALG